MKTSILIRSYKKDAEWLHYCLRSIDKFCSGFHEVVVVVPDYDYAVFASIPKSHTRGLVKVHYYPGNARKPMLECMYQACMADQWCPEADLVLNMDSDCIFTKPTRPEDYMQDGKPVLLIRTFESIKDRPMYVWKTPTERALCIPVTHETMARHPAVHHRSLYPSFRAHLEKVHMEPFHEWAVAGPNVFPWPWAEYPALGFWAYVTKIQDYKFIDVSNLSESEIEIQYKDRLKQGWTHFNPGTQAGVAGMEHQRREFEKILS